jgi:riboflavin transport system permease protein
MTSAASPMRPRRIARRAVAVGSALALAAAYAAAASGDPGSALYAFFVSPFASRYAFWSLVERAAPMLACAAGACLALKAGAFNLGGEGQAAAGALASAVSTAWLARMGVPPPIAIAAAIAAAAAAGAALAWASAAAEEWSGADIMLTSFLVSQAAVIAADWTMGTALREEGSNLLAMARIPEAYLLARLAPPSPLSAAAPISLAAALAAFAALRLTRVGKEIELSGKNPEFARAVGIPSRVRAGAMIASGALGGIAGAFLLLGQAGRAIKGMTGGVGWDGLSVALVAGTDPIASIPAALFFSWLDAGARQGSILSDLSPDSSAIMKAAALFLVTAAATGGLGAFRKRRGKGAARHERAERQEGATRNDTAEGGRAAV